MAASSMKGHLTHLYWAADSVRYVDVDMPNWLCRYSLIDGGDDTWYTLLDAISEDWVLVWSHHDPIIALDDSL